MVVCLGHSIEIGEFGVVRVWFQNDNGKKKGPKHYHALQALTLMLTPSPTRLGGWAHTGRDAPSRAARARARCGVGMASTGPSAVQIRFHMRLGCSERNYPYIYTSSLFRFFFISFGRSH